MRSEEAVVKWFARFKSFESLVYVFFFFSFCGISEFILSRHMLEQFDERKTL